LFQNCRNGRDLHKLANFKYNEKGEIHVGGTPLKFIVMESALDNVELDVAVDSDSMAVVADAEGKQSTYIYTFLYIICSNDILVLNLIVWKN
jgi:hypothetical protein